MKKINLALLLITITLFLSACESKSEVVNIYTTRHYDSDELLYKEFTNEMHSNTGYYGWAGKGLSSTL